jgi:ATPase subunit of ABC transporter with duplicated ATPase domains
MYFDPETYDERIGNLLVEIKKQNQQLQREEAWLNSQNQNRTLAPKKKKYKSKAQVRKEQLTKLQTQVPKIGNVSKFFNF